MAERLALAGLTAGYGPTVVLSDVSFIIEPGETVAILGRNGMGKTTLLESIAGLTTIHRGTVTWGSDCIEHWPTWRRARAGLGLVPQEREIFPSLTVEENLQVAKRGRAWTREAIYELFPRLGQRRRNRGSELSGGEQQMLAIGRALMGSPSALLLDEPLEGLAPIVVDAVVAALERLRREARMTMLLVEQHALLALGFAPRAVALVRGKVAYDGASAALAADESRLASLIGVSH
jgi:branched-chain amino acid transport system ATP-binding protein